MITIEQFRVNMGEKIVKNFGEESLNKQEQEIDIRNLKVRQLEDKKKEINKLIDGLKTKSLEVNNNISSSQEELLQPEEIENDKVKTLEKEIIISQEQLEITQKEIVEEEIMNIVKDKFLSLFKPFTNEQIIDALYYINKYSNILDSISPADDGKIFTKLDIVKDKNIIIDKINNNIDKMAKIMPVVSLFKLPLDSTTIINRIKIAQTLEQFLQIIIIFKDIIINTITSDSIYLAVAKHKWTDDELILLDETKESLAKKVQEIESKLANEKAAIELETPILVEEGISRLMFAYPGALRAEHNHLSPTNTVFTAQNSSGQQLTVVPLLDDNKQLTRVKIALSPIELFQDGTVVPFTFASQHHEQEFTFNAKVMAAITAFITNNGGFRTNTNDTSIELEDVKK